jgi:HIV Tat-specific factor 1
MASPSSAGGFSSFPVDPQEFDADERISFSKLDNKFLLVADDGSEYEFDDVLKRWIPVLDEELLEQQAAAYKVQGVDESVPVETGRKRKKEYVNGEDVSLAFHNPPTWLASLLDITRKKSS